MRWIVVDKYCDKSGDFLIATYFNTNGDKYGLSYFNKNYGYFDTKNKAKAKAEELANEANIHPSR